ncbi:hypothetical protein BKI52_18930 [marine bacterium AO1-C]|nr:hypothetical protein BKI52_18930 [marine bacterium AO1-C]
MKKAIQQISSPFLIAIILSYFTSISSFSQVTLLRDIYTGTENSNPSSFIEMNNKIYFIANSRLWKTDGTSNGTQQISELYLRSTSELIKVNNRLLFTSYNQLWVTDGTSDGTQKVKDGVTISNNYIVVNDQLYFANNFETSNTELWISDGTEAGTQLVKDINPGNVSSYPSYFQVYKNQVFFSADDGTHGREVWMTDGTEAGTKLLKDIDPSGSGIISLGHNRFFEFKGKLYFEASNGTGTEVWMTDGTEAGTTILKDINLSGTQGSNPRFLTLFGDHFIFQAQSDTQGTEAWISDGTEVGTKILKDIYTGINNGSPDGFTVFQGKIYFRATDNNHGSELWVTDGTEAGTQMLKDLNNGTEGSAPNNFVLINNQLFFVASDATNGAELWITDGTEAGTKLLKNINGSSTGSLGNTVFSYDFMWNAGGRLVFVADDGSNGKELWVSDGTEAGTQLLKDIRPGQQESVIQNVKVFNNQLFFQANDGTHGSEVWLSNGTQTGTKLLKDITSQPIGSFSKTSHRLIKYNNKIYFTANDDLKGQELWVTDGTDVGTQLFKDINPGSSNSAPQYFTVFKSKLYFYANGPSNQTGLWETDGTQANTRFITTVYISGSIVVVGDHMFFRAFDGTHGNELWISDGTSAGTRLVKDTQPGTLDGLPPFKPLASFKGQLVFVANDGTHGNELWISDGTDAGTTLLKDINPGSVGSAIPSGFTLFNDQLFFFATSATEGSELWTTDGTTAGTRIVKDVNPGSADGTKSFERPAILNGYLYFVATNSNGQKGLWKTDGTSSGTTELTASIFSSPEYLNVFNNQLFFTSRRSLYKTDGTETGTQQLTSGNTPLSFGGFFVFNDRMLFMSNQSDSIGFELWETNGTETGTRMIQDINTGPESSFPHFFGDWAIDNKIMLVANNDQFGRELHVYNKEAFPAILTPKITDFSPKSGFAGTEVTITGENFSAVKSSNLVKFNGTTAEVLNASNASLTVKIADGTSTGKITIDIADGTSFATSEDFIISQVTSLTDVLNENSINVFPNPTTNILQVTHLNPNHQSLIYQVYTLHGRLVHKGKSMIKGTQALIDVKQLPTGSYLLLIEVGKETIQKIIVKK